VTKDGSLSDSRSDVIKALSCEKETLIAEYFYVFSVSTETLRVEVGEASLCIGTKEGFEFGISIPILPSFDSSFMNLNNNGNN